MPVFTVLCRCSSAIPSSLLVPLMSGPVLKPVIICCGASWALTRPRPGTNNMATRPKGEAEKKNASLILGIIDENYNSKTQCNSNYNKKIKVLQCMKPCYLWCSPNFPLAIITEEDADVKPFLSFFFFFWMNNTTPCNFHSVILNQDFLGLSGTFYLSFLFLCYPFV